MENARRCVSESTFGAERVASQQFKEKDQALAWRCNRMWERPSVSLDPRHVFGEKQGGGAYAAAEEISARAYERR